MYRCGVKPVVGPCQWVMSDTPLARIVVLERGLLPVVGVVLEAGEVVVVDVTESSSTGATAATVDNSSSSSTLDCWNERVVLESIDANNSVAEKIWRCTRGDIGEEDGCTGSIVVL